MRARWRIWSVVTGVCLAAVYSLTPLTICVVAAAAAILPLFAKGLPGPERRWLTAIVAAALVARLLAIGVVFARNLPTHDDQFAGATSGDEAYTMGRALRTRDIVRGSTTNNYDFFIAFDEYGRNSYVAALTAAQVIFGPTPYSLRLLNTLLFTVGALLLFRLSRDAFGVLPAFGGLIVVLFWPTLFIWSMSLLKESLYFLLGVAVLTAAISVVRRPRWRSRAVSVVILAATAASAQDLRPQALMLIASGLAAGYVAYVVTASKRTFAIAMVAGAVALTIAFSRPALEARVMRGLEAAARTHTGHVFTVGHDYRLLDDGFYVNPQTPASSTLTLRRDEAARFVIRALSSFVVVPAPWQLQSLREVAYLPEQLAWYALVVFLPVGIVAAYRRDRLLTCMLVGYVAPTAAALALTNGNVGTLLRLRGLVIPYLAWVAAVGFCAALGTLGQKNTMRLIDDDGRLFGRLNLFDAAIVAFVIVLIPAAYGTFLLFRTPVPRIASVTRVPITREERRVAGGNRLSAKLKVRGSGLRPRLRASIDSTPALGFVFEDPNSADVLVGEVPSGTHDLILYDGVEEVARLAKSVTIESVAPPRVAVVGTLMHLDKSRAEALAPGALASDSQAVIVKLGAVQAEPGDRWQRRAEILLQCDPDPNEEGCAVLGVLLASTPQPTLKLAGPSDSRLSFAVHEVFAAAPATMVESRIRVVAVPELLDLIRAGDRDDCLDERAATVVRVGSRRAVAGATEMDVTLRLGVDQSAEGPRYRGRLFKAGAPFTLSTERYVVAGTVLEAGDRREGVSK